TAHEHSRKLFYFHALAPAPAPTLFPYTTLFRSSPNGSSFGSSCVQPNSATPSSSSTARNNGSSSASGRGRVYRMSSSASSPVTGDRKSTRLNSSHVEISYAVFCLKKKEDRLS